MPLVCAFSTQETHLAKGIKETTCQPWLSLNGIGVVLIPKRLYVMMNAMMGAMIVTSTMGCSHAHEQ